MANERYSDNEIMELFADCDTREAAFRIVVSQYGPHLYSRIRTVVPTHDEADDILQNTFIKAWRAMPKFRLESSLDTWLFRIATNEPVLLSCHLYAACHNAIDRLLHCLSPELSDTDF